MDSIVQHTVRTYCTLPRYLDRGSLNQSFLDLDVLVRSNFFLDGVANGMVWYTAYYILWRGVTGHI